MISTTDFLILWATTFAAILACRCLPMLLLRGRELPEGVTSALSMIPTAAFAALVANDLLSPDMFAGGVWAGLMPVVAAAGVVVVARKTGSLVWCAVTGLVLYILLGMIG